MTEVLISRQQSRWSSNFGARGERKRGRDVGTGVAGCQSTPL